MVTMLKLYAINSQYLILVGRCFIALVHYAYSILLLGSQVLSGSLFGFVNAPLFIENLDCQGSEQHLLDCNDINLRRMSCSHDNDVSVRCTGM